MNKEWPAGSQLSTLCRHFTAYEKARHKGDLLPLLTVHSTVIQLAHHAVTPLL